MGNSEFHHTCCQTACVDDETHIAQVSQTPAFAGAWPVIPVIVEGEVGREGPCCYTPDTVHHEDERSERVVTQVPAFPGEIMRGAREGTCCLLGSVEEDACMVQVAQTPAFPQPVESTACREACCQSQPDMTEDPNLAGQVVDSEPAFVGFTAAEWELQLPEERERLEEDSDMQRKGLEASGQQVSKQNKAPLSSRQQFSQIPKEVTIDEERNAELEHIIELLVQRGREDVLTANMQLHEIDNRLKVLHESKESLQEIGPLEGPIRVSAIGSCGISELSKKLPNDNMSWALLRLIYGSHALVRSIWVTITCLGSETPSVLRARTTARSAEVLNHLGNANVSLGFTSAEECTPDTVFGAVLSEIEANHSSYTLEQLVEENEKATQATKVRRRLKSLRAQTKAFLARSTPNASDEKEDDPAGIYDAAAGDEKQKLQERGLTPVIFTENTGPCDSNSENCCLSSRPPEKVLKTEDEAPCQLSEQEEAAWFSDAFHLDQLLQQQQMSDKQATNDPHMPQCTTSEASVAPAPDSHMQSTRMSKESSEHAEIAPTSFEKVQQQEAAPISSLLRENAELNSEIVDPTSASSENFVEDAWSLPASASPRESTPFCSDGSEQVNQPSAALNKVLEEDEELAPASEFRMQSAGHPASDSEHVDPNSIPTGKIVEKQEEAAPTSGLPKETAELNSEHVDPTSMSSQKDLFEEAWSSTASASPSKSTTACSDGSEQVNHPSVSLNKVSEREEKFVPASDISRQSAGHPASESEHADPTSIPTGKIVENQLEAAPTSGLPKESAELNSEHVDPTSASSEKDLEEQPAPISGLPKESAELNSEHVDPSSAPSEKKDLEEQPASASGLCAGSYENVNHTSAPLENILQKEERASSASPTERASTISAPATARGRPHASSSGSDLSRCAGGEGAGGGREAPPSAGPRTAGAPHSARETRDTQSRAAGLSASSYKCGDRKSGYRLATSVRLEMVLAAVAGPGLYNWAILEPEKLDLHNAGCGGFEEMKDWFEPQKVMFGVIRVSLGAGSNKHVFVHWNGPEVSPAKKGLWNFKVSLAEERIRSFMSINHRITAHCIKDLDLVSMMKELKLATSEVDECDVYISGLGADFQAEEIHLRQVMADLTLARSVASTGEESVKVIREEEINIQDDPQEDIACSDIPDLHEALRDVRKLDGQWNWVLVKIASDVGPKTLQSPGKLGSQAATSGELLSPKANSAERRAPWTSPRQTATGKGLWRSPTVDIPTCGSPSESTRVSNGLDSPPNGGFESTLTEGGSSYGLQSPDVRRKLYPNRVFYDEEESFFL